jgi:membrane protease YdiL (CAAX protease family)
MKHLESSFSGKNSFWRYLVMMVLILLVANSIGSIPLVIALFIKSQSDPSVVSQYAANPSDMGILGLSPNAGFIVMMIPFITSLIAFILLIRPLNHRSFKNVINGTSKIRWNRFFISAFVWFMLSAIYFFIYLKFDPSNFALNSRTTSIFLLAVISLLFIPFQAALEEVVFRGYLMQGFAVLAKNRWFPMIMTSVLFGLLHAFNPEVKEFGFFTMVPQYIVFGLIFGIVTIFDDGIEAAMGAHAANNIFLSIMVTSESSILQTPALYVQHAINPWNEFAGLLISGIVFIWILKLIFKWESIAVLFGKINVPKKPAGVQIL